MKLNNQIFLLLILSAFSCRDKVETFYDNGQVKSSVAMENGLKNGLMKEYYPDGTLKVQTNWQNGILNGKMIKYYETGQKESEVNWINGKKDGIVRAFHKNGELKFKGQYISDFLVGESWHYFESGNKMEKQVYDSTGVLINFYKYDTNGLPRIDALKPLFAFDKDTISLGERIHLEFRLGSQISTDLRVYLGTLPERDKLGLIDTLQEVRGVNNEVFKYSFKPEKIGHDSISGKMIHKLKTDTAEHIHEFAFIYRYFVKEGEQI
ncbi:MAG: toxin-antitoxin system YwqK family antitoxin [Cyclobacteriaceae bacterium]